jgi:hypothetical protein
MEGMMADFTITAVTISAVVTALAVSRLACTVEKIHALLVDHFYPEDDADLT